MRKSPMPCEYVSFVEKVTALVGGIAALVAAPPPSNAESHAMPAVPAPDVGYFMCATMFSPNSLHLISMALSINRAKS